MRHDTDTQCAIGIGRYVSHLDVGLGTALNRKQRCDLCDQPSVHFGQVVEYGRALKIFGRPVFRTIHGRFVACRECKDPIGYELGDYVPEEYDIT